MLERISDVLIVGAGPAGLALALDLTRRGVPVRIIDKAPDAAAESRALAIHPRTLEVFEQIGVLDEVLAQGEELHGAQFRSASTGQTVGEIRFDDLDTPFPFTLALEQSRTERILASHLLAAGVEIERSTEIVAVGQDESRVRARVRRSAEPQRATEHTVSARYLVGCDGAHSSVRSLLELSYEGVTGEERYLLADCRVRFDQKPPEGEMLAYLGEKSRLLFGHLPANGGQFWRVLITLREDDPRMPKGDPIISDLREIMRTDFPMAGLTLSDAKWVSVFKINTRMVDRFRVGRCFVAGDAAHIHSPSGGQGMNTGIQDAFNLSWKLELALRGADDLLLDSYEAERKPVAKTILRSTRAADFLLTKQHGPQFAKARDTLLPWFTSLELVQHRIPEVLAGGTVAYRRSPITRPDPESLGQRVKNAADELVSIVKGVHKSASSWEDLSPGDLVPDADGVHEIGAGAKRFYTWLAQDPRHHLLVFVDSDGHGRQAPEALWPLVASFNDRWAHLVRTRAVVSDPDSAENPSLTLVDSDRDLSRKLSRRQTISAVLIRPDGYLAYRSEVFAIEEIEEFLTIIQKR